MIYDIRREFFGCVRSSYTHLKISKKLWLKDLKPNFFSPGEMCSENGAINGAAGACPTTFPICCFILTVYFTSLAP